MTSCQQVSIKSLGASVSGTERSESKSANGSCRASDRKWGETRTMLRATSRSDCKHAGL